MIITEMVEISGRQFIHTRSDSNRYIVRDGIPYEDAYDPAEFGRKYTEGDTIEGVDEAEAMLSTLLGGAT